MSRSLFAALLLLIVSGSGAAFSMYVLTSANDEDVPVAAESAAQAQPTALQSEPSPTSAAVEAPRPTADREPDSAPTPQAQTETPPALPQTPDPTSTPGDSPDPTATLPVPEWAVVAPERFAPTGIVIPDIGVNASVVDVGINDAGEMEAPSGYEEVGWLRYSAKPGEQGRVVLAGHVDSKDGPAVFYRLRDLVPGVVIEVTAGAGTETLRYVVREAQRYPQNDAPLERIFGPSDRSELILITCDGDFDFEAGEYPDRLIIFAELVPEGS